MGEVCQILNVELREARNTPKDYAKLNIMNKNFYTVGHTKTYDDRLESNDTIFKLGKSTDYSGGIVFKSINDALSTLEKWEDGDQYSVYLLDTVEENIYLEKKDNHFYLLNECPILKKIEVNVKDYPRIPEHVSRQNLENIDDYDGEF